jgi:hypothetical protein
MKLILPENVLELVTPLESTVVPERNLPEKGHDRKGIGATDHEHRRDNGVSWKHRNL